MELVNFDNCEESDEVYEGKSGDRIGIIYNNENYLLKFPGNLKAKEFKNISLDYSNSPLCEYIGSHIQKKFYTTLIKTRFEKVTEPTYRRIIAKESKQIAELKEKSVSAERHFTPDMLTESTKTPELPSPAKAPTPGRRGIGKA